LVESQQRANADHEISDQKNGRAPGRHFQAVESGAAAAKYGGCAKSDGCVPENRADENNRGAGQSRAAKAAQQPKTKAQRGRHTEAVKKGGILRGVVQAWPARNPGAWNLSELTSSSDEAIRSQTTAPAKRVSMPIGHDAPAPACCD
jgi:hypothetical protein